jgi:hypothetical protein
VGEVNFISDDDGRLKMKSRIEESNLRPEGGKRSQRTTCYINNVKEGGASLYVSQEFRA